MEPRPTRLPPPAAAAWALPVLALLALAFGVWAGAAFLVPIFMALVFAVLLWPALRWVERIVRSRVLAALLVVLGTATAAAALTGSVALQLSSTSEQLPTALRQLARDVARLPTDGAQAFQRTRSALDELDRSVARLTGTERAPGGNAATQASIVATAVAWSKDFALAASRATLGVLLQCGVVVLLCFFILCNGESLASRLQRICERTAPRAHRCGATLVEGARQIRLFAGVTVVTNLLFGAFVALGFVLFGVPGALLWGLAAAALHFVPYAGLAVMVVLAALQAYVVQGSIAVAMLAAAYVAAVGVVIGTAVTVALQGRAARIDSAVLFAGTVFWSVLWGAWGLVLGPLLVVIGRLVTSEVRLLAARDATPGEATAAAPVPPPVEPRTEKAERAESHAPLLEG